MPLETATYISDLVTSNPASSDGLNDAGAHFKTNTKDGIENPAPGKVSLLRMPLAHL